MSLHGVIVAIACGTMGVNHPQLCTKLCFQENLGTGGHLCSVDNSKDPRVPTNLTV